MKKACTLCGCSRYDTFAFKGGHVCETCLQYLKSDFDADAKVRTHN